ncbi:hypothetical protein Nepgr_018095 [Nepenthes gracilis]|uniref:Uncharacterized protein n=1 Tax=Nepenthes gracilis TaxID=150966 RepID=A0AAD3SSU0_NEPGR|nr:hypothetical protein Nepgr_018095 [Nepenthes gracilis]
MDSVGQPPIDWLTILLHPVLRPSLHKVLGPLCPLPSGSSRPSSTAHAFSSLFLPWVVRAPIASQSSTYHQLHTLTVCAPLASPRAFVLLSHPRIITAMRLLAICVPSKSCKSIPTFPLTGSRLTVASGARYMVARSKTLPLRPVTSNPLISPFSSSSSTRAASSASSFIRWKKRLASVLGTLESQKPLHTATATSRLKSIIAVDSSCWSWLSQDFAVPR